MTHPQFKRIIVSFDAAVSPGGMRRDNKKFMGEFMRCVGSGGLGFESDDGEPVSWSAEIYDDPADIPARLQSWWRQYAPGCVVRTHGLTPFRTTDDIAHVFSIEPA